MSVPKEAIEAARSALWPKDINEYDVKAALTAALPHLAEPSKSDAKWHDDAVNGALRKALAVMVVRQGKLEEAEAAKDAEIARLREALEPFKQAVDRIEYFEDGLGAVDWPLFAEDGRDNCLNELLDGIEGSRLTVAHLRRARAALEMSGGVK